VTSDLRTALKVLALADPAATPINLTLVREALSELLDGEGPRAAPATDAPARPGRDVPVSGAATALAERWRPKAIVLRRRAADALGASQTGDLGRHLNDSRGVRVLRDGQGADRASGGQPGPIADSRHYVNLVTACHGECV
jgi:hypothetical protein